MSALPWIGAALGVGLLYLLYKSKQDTTQDDFCTKACKAAGVFCIDGGASCRAASGALAGSGFNAGGTYYAARDKRQAVNDGLNGPAQILNDPQGIGYDVTSGGLVVNPVGTKVLRYANGCVPLEYSPGWYKCKAGTLDMYSSAIDHDPDAHSALNQTETNLVEVGAFLTIAERNQTVANTSRPWARINKDHAMTGATGDPATQGPYGTESAPWWYVRGQKVSGSPGLAPRAVVMQHYGPGGERDASIVNLTDAQAKELVSIYTDPAIIHTDISDTCGVVNPGFTWVGPAVGGHWERPAVGQAPRARPCATPDPSATVAHFIGL